MAPLNFVAQQEAQYFVSLYSVPIWAVFATAVVVITVVLALTLCCGQERNVVTTPSSPISDASVEGQQPIEEDGEEQQLQQLQSARSVIQQDLDLLDSEDKSMLPSQVKSIQFQSYKATDSKIGSKSIDANAPGVQCVDPNVEKVASLRLMSVRMPQDRQNDIRVVELSKIKETVPLRRVADKSLQVNRAVITNVSSSKQKSFGSIVVVKSPADFSVSSKRYVIPPTA